MDGNERFRSIFLFQLGNFVEGLRTKYTLIVSSLLVSLFVYLFYRTEQTVINHLVIATIGEAPYWVIRDWINQHIHLGPFGVYSLPEALWVLAITLLSKRYYLGLNRLKISLKFVPVLLVIGFEWFQFAHWANGRFDWVDLAGGIVFWVLGLLVLPEKEPKASLLAKWNFHGVACVLSYAIVYLAHVIQ